MKHTEGKWEYDNTGRYYDKGVIRKNGVLIAKMITQMTHIKGEVEANARLIAAAPELLEACKWTAGGEHHSACSIHRSIKCNCYVGVCQNAIAKAEGTHD